MARLIIKGEDSGIRPFIVRICSTREPYPGILSIRQPIRSSASPLDVSVTLPECQASANYLAHRHP